VYFCYDYDYQGGLALWQEDDVLCACYSTDESRTALLHDANVEVPSAAVFRVDCLIQEDYVTGQPDERTAQRRGGEAG